MTKPKQPRYNPRDHFTRAELDRFAKKFEPKPTHLRTPRDWEIAELLGTTLNPVGENLDALSPEFRAAAADWVSSNRDDSAPGRKTSKSGKQEGYRGYGLHAIVSHGSVPFEGWVALRAAFRKLKRRRKL